MVAVLIRIKLTTTRHSMTGSRAVLMMVGSIIGLLLAAVTILLCEALSETSAGSVNLLCLAFLLWTLGWVVGPLLTGGETTLRPEYFQSLPIPPGRLAAGLLLATFVGIAPLMSILAFTGIVLYALHFGAFPTLVAIIAAPLQFMCVLLLSRVMSRGVGQVMQARLGMELGALFIGFGIAFFNVGWWALPAIVQAVSAQSPRSSLLLRVLPSGWAVVAVDAASHANGLVVVAPLLGLAVLCGLLLLAWTRLLTHPSATTSSNAARLSQDSSYHVLPASPVGAVMEKEVHTWWRDPVRGRFLRMGIWMAVFFGVLPAIAGASGVLPWIGPLAVIFTTAFAGNIYGFDGSALWLTLTTPEAERADVRGRQSAWLLIVTPVASTLTIIFTAVSGQDWGWSLAAALIPALLGGGAGVIVLVSVRMLVPATDPHRRGRSIVIAGDDVDVGQLQVQGFLTLAIMVVLVAPAAAVTLLGLAMQQIELQWAGIALGLVTGLTAYWWFGRLAYRELAIRGPTLLALMSKGRSSRQSRL